MRLPHERIESMAASTRKKSTAKRNTKKKQPPKQEMNAAWSILFFGVGLLLLALAFFPSNGAVWHFLREQVLFGVFGTCAYFTAPLMIYVAVLVARKCPIKKPLFKCLLLLFLLSGTVLVFSAASGPLTAVNASGLRPGFGDAVSMLHTDGARVANCAAVGEFFAGGDISAVFGWTLLMLCGTVGARIIMIIFTVLCVMYITVTTPQDIYAYCATKVESARDNIAQYTAERKERIAKRKEVEAFDFEKDEESARATRGRKWGKKKQVDIPLDEPTEKAAAPHTRSRIDIDLGPDTQTDPENGVDFEPLDIGPGGTFGRPEFAKPAEQPAAQPATDSLDTLVRKAAGPQAELAVDNNDQLQIVERGGKQNYIYPPITLFQKQTGTADKNVEEELRRNAELLVKTLSSFGVQTKVLDIARGPSVTRYELQPLTGVKISRITSLADDIALNLAATGVRIEAPIPGKAAVGIEIPNKTSVSVNIRSILESREFVVSDSPVPMALGKDIAGKNWVANLIKMPHILIAGATGSGKSVCINSIIMSFLYKSSPEDLRLIMIDPKMVELMDYNGIPHLLMPVVTEPRKAAGALGSAVAEMEKRYRMFAEQSVRNIEAYNKWALENDQEKMPYIAIIIDELADLMMVAGKEVEDYICRIAQKARAAGMHLIVATQRPSVDVITGLIKANIPSRIAFSVSSQIDSRTILDGAGAEKLLGKGDMLFMPVGASKPVRIQGTYVHDDEITKVLDFIKKNSTADYNETMIQDMEKCTVAEKNSDSSDGGDSRDSMFDNAVEVVLDAGQASTSLLQRRLKLGYARAARIVDEMEQAGVVGPYEGSKPRQVLISRNQWLEMQMKQTDEEQA